MAGRRLSPTWNVENLLEAVTQHSAPELREFQRRLAVWQADNGQHAAGEAMLIQAAQARLPAAEESRLKQLMAKSERGTLTTQELAEYQSLAQRSEQLDLARTEALAELARRRGQPVSAILRALGHGGGGDGP
jgi:hypothetical protein